jgi:hypothetical protein
MFQNDYRVNFSFCPNDVKVLKPDASQKSRQHLLFAGERFIRNAPDLLNDFFPIIRKIYTIRA